ncbi:MAG TPA: molybdate ABC transporter permease subunit [Thermoanaerobaculia bacterium]|nr:molybdate ABC transporter permease subunit [Thermoanaerobaculia bacterium]
MSLVSDLPVLALTFRIAAIATIVMLPLALVLALASSRILGPNARTFIDALCSLPLILPPTAVGFLLLELLSRDGWIGATGLDLLFTPTAAVIAAAVMSFPLMFRSFRAAIDSADFRYFQLARTLGKRPLPAFFLVIIPLSWPGLVSGVILAFCRAIGEFGATILIAGSIPGRTQTLALAIYERTQSGREEEAFSLLLYAVVLAFGAIATTELLMNRHRRRMTR